MAYSIRLAQRQDLPKIIEIYNSTIASRQVTADLQPVTLSERQNWFDNHQQNPYRPLYGVYAENNTLIAWASFSDYYPREAYDITAEISIYIDEKYRNQGLGGYILDYMLQQATDLNIQNIIALIFAHNLPSIRLFQRYGFQQWGRLPKICDLKTQLADVLILGKHLQEN